MSSHVFIHTSCSHHLEQVARALLENNADIEKPNNNGWTPLMKACSNGHEQVRSYQLDCLDSCEQLPCIRFHTCSSHHLDQVARALLENAADVNAVQKNELKWTALMFAAQNGHDRVRSSQVEHVVSCGQLLCAHVHTSSSHHLEQVVRALLEAKADPEKVNKDSFTALMIAAQNGHDLCARALLEAKANLEVQTNQGFTKKK